MRYRISQFVLGMFAGAGLLGAGLIFGAAGASAPPMRPPAQAGAAPADVIRARSIEIVDEIGTIVLAIGSNERGGSISVRDRFGKTLILAGATEHGGRLAISGVRGEQPAFAAGATDMGASAELFGRDGKPIIAMLSNADGASLKLTDEAGRPALTLRASEDTGGEIAAYSGAEPRAAGADSAPADGAQNEEPVIATRIFADLEGGGVIETYCATGAPLVALSSTIGGHGQVSTFGGLARPLVTLTATATHEGQIYTYNGDGNPLIALASQPGGPTLRIFNREGEAIITLESDEEANGLIGVWRKDGAGRVVKP